MNWLLITAVRVVVRMLQALPLRVVARFGRACGALVWILDARHRRVALDNLSRCLGASHSPQAIRALARENFRRIGENFASAVKTSAMSDAALSEVIEVHGLEKLRTIAANPRKSCVVAIGHFGNFELFANAARLLPGWQSATTYRALHQPGLNRIMQALREKSGCRFFERRSEAQALKEAMNRGSILLGLLSDQYGGSKGVWAPFLGRECSTSPAPALFALRYKCPLLTSFCYRVGLGRWRLEVGEPIPTHDVLGHARPVESIVHDINQAFEVAVRRDYANWFWVHRRWKRRA